MNRLAVVLVIAAVALGLSGCWDRRELEEVGWVMVLGLDAAPERRVEVTVVMAVPRGLEAGEAGGGSGGQTFFVTSAVGDGLVDALNFISAYVSRQVSLSHAKAVVIGEETARAGIGTLLGTLARERESRRIMSVVVAEGRAADFLSEIDPILEINPGVYIEEIISSRKTTGFYETALLHDVLVALESPAEDALAIRAALGRGGEPGRESAAAVTAGRLPRRGGPMLEFAGLAVFRGDRLVGVLNAEEARAVAMLRGSFERAFISIPGPDQGGARIILDVRQGSPPHINIDLERETPHLSINLSLEADIVSAAGRDQRRPESLEALGRHAGEVLTGRVRDVLARAQEEFRADIFGFGRHAQARFGTWQSWLAYDWLDRFPLAEVEVEVDLRLRRVGLEFGELRPR